MKTTDEILKEILLPNDDNWEIVSVVCNDELEEIRVKLNYCKQGVEVDGVSYPIYDHRKEREWRHLDLWQYKTYIVARVPRYQKDGKAISVEGSTRFCVGRHSLPMMVWFVLTQSYVRSMCGLPLG